MIVHITRHGQVHAISEGEETDVFFAPGDPPLSSLGRRQAWLLGKYLRKLGFAGEVYSSPYRRTTETGQIIADTADVPLCLAPGMRESNGDGENMKKFRGLTAIELQTDYPRLRVDRDISYPWWTTDAEAADDVEARVAPEIDLLMTRETDVLLVGHGASVGAATRHVLKRHAPELLERPRFPWNCMLTSMRLAPEFELLRLSSTDHLPDEAMTSNSKKREQVLEILARAAK